MHRVPTCEQNSDCRILIQEVVIDLDDNTNEAVATVHWTGGRHTELRVARVNVGRYPSSQHFSAVEVMRKLGGQWPDRELAVTMNRMRCKSPDGKTWSTFRVTELRERLGIAPFDPMASHAETISVEEASRRLGIYGSSIHRLIREGILPATQLMPSAPWKVPVAALESEAVREGVRAIKERRPPHFKDRQEAEKSLKLPGF
jgi:hypothetical protein